MNIIVNNDSNSDSKENLEYFNQNFDIISKTYFPEIDNKYEEKKIKEKANEIIQRYAIIEGITYNHSVIGICSLFQAGVCLNRVLNRIITIQGIEFTKKTLLFSSDQVGNKYTLRSVAKSMRDTIVQVAYKYNIQGHLYRKFKIENIENIFCNEEKDLKKYSIYCTDFNLDNPSAPLIVRKFLYNRQKMS